jgi:hypothetical protein
MHADQPTQELSPQAERRRYAEVQAGAPCDGSLLGPRRLDQLRRDPRLADPALSRERGNGTMPVLGLTPDLDQSLQLGDPTGERVAVSERRRIIGRPELCHPRSRLRSAEFTRERDRVSSDGPIPSSLRNSPRSCS